MKLNTLMTITAIVSFIFGLGFILAPSAVMGMYGNTLDLAGQFLGRYFGAALLALAFLAWYNRSAPSKGVVSGFFIGMVLGLVVSVWDAFAGAHN